MSAESSKARVSEIIRAAKAAITAKPDPVSRKPDEPVLPPRPLVFAGDEPTSCAVNGHEASKPRNAAAFEKLGYYTPYCMKCGVRMKRRELQRHDATPEEA